jgi:flagellar basal-body rod protein FlgB
MIEGLFNQPNYVAVKKLLDVSELRHQAIASNLANVETPHYKRLDVAPNFATQLQQAIQSRNTGRIAHAEPELAVDTTAIANRKDGNTVQLEDELLRLNRNYLEHHLETQLVSGTILRLRLAITGRPS